MDFIWVKILTLICPKKNSNAVIVKIFKALVKREPRIL